MIIVRVRTHDAFHRATSDSVDDRIGRVGGVDNDAFRIVTDDPNVVIDFPLATVECEHTVRDDPANFQARFALTFSCQFPGIHR